MGLSFSSVHAHLLCCVSLFKLFLPTLSTEADRWPRGGGEGEVAATTRFGMREGGR